MIIIHVISSIYVTHAIKNALLATEKKWGEYQRKHHYPICPQTLFHLSAADASGSKASGPAMIPKPPYPTPFPPTSTPFNPPPTPSLPSTPPAPLLPPTSTVLTLPPCPLPNAVNHMVLGPETRLPGRRRLACALACWRSLRPKM